MARIVPEWRGKTDDTRAPDRVRLRVFEAKGGRCHSCGRKIPAGETWTLEHVVALVNGGENRESNLDITCGMCLPTKNRADMAIKKKAARVKKKHAGIRPKTKFRGWRRMNGEIVWAEDRS